jgi:hypothetical protein
LHFFALSSLHLVELVSTKTKKFSSVIELMGICWCRYENRKKLLLVPNLGSFDHDYVTLLCCTGMHTPLKNPCIGQSGVSGTWGLLGNVLIFVGTPLGMWGWLSDT